MDASGVKRWLIYPISIVFARTWFISDKAPMLLTGIKILGALYLLYLGIQSWRNADSELGDNQLQVTPTPFQLFKTGIWVSLSNPKAILFFAAFFPKFINFNAPLMPQYVILTLGFLPLRRRGNWTYRQWQTVSDLAKNW